MQTGQTNLLYQLLRYRRLAIYISTGLCDMADEDVAPSEVHHYKSTEEVPWDIQKYVPLSILLEWTHQR
jgi:hypothetical protein